MAVHRAVSPPMNCITFDPHGSLLLLLQRADQGDLRCMTIQFKIYNDYEITALRKLVSRTGFSRVSIWRFGSVILDSLLLIHCSIPQIRVQLDCDSRSLTTRIDPRSCTRSWNALAFPQTDKVLFISRKLFANNSRLFFKNFSALLTGLFPSDSLEIYGIYRLYWPPVTRQCPCRVTCLTYVNVLPLQIVQCSIKIELVNDSWTELRGEIAGPPDTPYEGGKFLLEIKVPETYPFNPPKVRFYSKMRI